MEYLSGKKVCVLGLGLSGKSAVNLLLEKKAHVIAIDDFQDCLSPKEIEDYKERGVIFFIGSDVTFPVNRIDMAVVSPGVSREHSFVKELVARCIPLLGELELGWRELQCPCIAISGTDGKTTVTGWIVKMLRENGYQVTAAGNIGTPVCDVALKSEELSSLVMEVSSFQLESVDSFKPEIALLLNVAEDHLDRHGSIDNYLRIKARLFENQKEDDYAIIQWEILQKFKQMEISLPSKTLTFSDSEESANLYLKGNLIKSRMSGWPDTVLDLNRCNFRGSHNAVNLMASLLAGRASGLSLEKMIQTSLEFQSGAHRCEFIAEWNGVKFYNDSKATNVHALLSALHSMPDNEGDRKNIWLIAGGQNKAFDFRTISQDTMRRVKSVYLLGEASAEMRSAWQSFVPCNLVEDMIEAVFKAGRCAVPGDVVLLSPACASFDMFDSYQHRGESYCVAVQQWLNTMKGV